MARSKIVVIKPKKPGQKPLKFKKGALHRQLGVPEGQPIPKEKIRAALRGEYGPLAKKRAVFAFKGALAAGRRTIQKMRKAASGAYISEGMKRLMKAFGSRG